MVEGSVKTKTEHECAVAIIDDMDSAQRLRGYTDFATLRIRAASLHYYPILRIAPVRRLYVKQTRTPQEE